MANSILVRSQQIFEMISRHLARFTKVLTRPLTFVVGKEYVNTRVDKFIMDKYPRVPV